MSTSEFSNSNIDVIQFIRLLRLAFYYSQSVVASLGGAGGGADRPRWYSSGGDTRKKENIFVGKFTKNSGQTRFDR